MLMVLAQTAYASKTEPVNPPFTILDSKYRGTFNIGMGLAGVTVEKDKGLGKEVLKFDYSLPRGSVIGLWTKDYPPELVSGVADAARIGVNVPEAGQLKQVSVTLEFKGKRAMQKVPLPLENGWNYIEEAIDWNMIGALREVVFVVKPMAGNSTGASPVWFNQAAAGGGAGEEPLEGLLYFDLTFYKLSFLQKYFIFIRLGLVLLLALAAAGVVKWLG